MSVRHDDAYRISGSKFGMPLWQPTNGQGVEVVKGPLKGSHGEVLRNKGLGKFAVKLDDGRVINPFSTELTALDV